MTKLLVGLLALASAGMKTIAASSSAPAFSALVQVFSNGVVECPTGAFSGGHATTGVAVRFDFGLPPALPARRFLLDNLPILQTEWEYRGVRYTQRVLVTRLGEGPLDGMSEDAVLGVQIAGESLVQEYTNASASLSLKVGRDPWPLELRGGWIYCPGQAPLLPLAFLDIPSVGIVKTNGLRLEFEGHMPPANSGAMTLWVPRQQLAPGPVRERLLDLDFGETLNKVRDFWRRPEARKIRPPLGWGDAPSGTGGGKQP
ncbi:hypothetical protein NXS98_06320 [Fontisphaera persica]|uniref:hypothetical protein n=1 Tax=Fontisphaera persica TaxID=2974023 RepID=UPI0024BFB4D2|nr:hypothetical protein [Fontisphaera persica]WCJ60740.1 hypothetical protein NXS98_06320 [Fontisphaera persica]